MPMVAIPKGTVSPEGPSRDRLEAFDALATDDDGFWAHGKYRDGIVVITMDFQRGAAYDPPGESANGNVTML
jgi:hypothetical protein